MKKLFLLLMVIVVCSSCEDDIVPTLPPPPPPANYAPMTVGNWWVYRMISYNLETGDSVFFAYPDTVHVLSDSTIDGAIYYKLSGGPYNFSSPHFVRDSSGYIIGPESYLHYTYTNSTDTFWMNPDTLGYRILKPDPQNTTVPAGSFQTLNFQKTEYDFYTPFNCGLDTAYWDFQFSENVGVVRYSFSYTATATCVRTERQLVDYYVQ